MFCYYFKAFTGFIFTEYLKNKGFRHSFSNFHHTRSCSLPIYPSWRLWTNHEERWDHGGRGEGKQRREVGGSSWKEKKWGTNLSPGSFPLAHSENFATPRKKIRRKVNKINYFPLKKEARFFYFLSPISSKLKPVVYIISWTYIFLNDYKYLDLFKKSICFVKVSIIGFS